MTRLLTIIETHEFVRLAKALKLSKSDLENIKTLLAAQPDIGTPLGSGLYKVRIARKGGGKSGGYRVIYFYRTDDYEIYLLDIFAKSNKVNASTAEMKTLRQAARDIGKDIK